MAEHKSRQDFNLVYSVFLEKKTVVATALELNKAVSTIQRVLKANGVELPKRGGKRGKRIGESPTTALKKRIRKRALKRYRLKHGEALNHYRKTGVKKEYLDLLKKLNFS